MLHDWTLMLRREGSSGLRAWGAPGGGLGTTLGLRMHREVSVGSCPRALNTGKEVHVSGAPVQGDAMVMLRGWQ